MPGTTFTGADFMHDLDISGEPRLRIGSLFSGYGDSLLDYNYKRTALSVGLSLLDF